MKAHVILFSLLLNQQIFGQNILPVKVNNLWGFINTEGKLVVNPVYDHVVDMEGYGKFFLLKAGGKSGLINQQGKVIIPPVYDHLSRLNDRYFLTTKAGLKGLVDTSGKTGIDALYSGICYLREDYYSLKKGSKYSLFDLKKGVVISAPFDSVYTCAGFFGVRNDTLYGLIDLNGKLIVPPAFDNITFASEMVLVQRNHLWGAYDVKGQLIFEPHYIAYERLDRGYMQFRKDSLWCLYSPLFGRIISSEQYSYFKIGADNFITALDHGKYGLLNASGKKIIVPQYDDLWYINEGMYKWRKDRKAEWGLTDTSGKELLPNVYQDIYFFNNNFALVVQNYCFGMVTNKGETGIEPKEDRIDVYKNSAKARNGDKLLIVSLDQKTGKLNKRNYDHVKDIIIGSRLWRTFPSTLTPAVTSSVVDRYGWYFSEKEKLWGLKDLNTGRIKIYPSYSKVTDIENTGLTIVERPCGALSFRIGDLHFYFYSLIGIVNHEKGYESVPPSLIMIRKKDFETSSFAFFIDKKGTAGMLYKDGHFRMFNEGGFIDNFHDKVAAVNEGGKLSTTYLDTLKAFLPVKKFIDDMFFASHVYANNCKYFPLEKLFMNCEGGSWGYINSDGKMLIQPSYSYARTSYHHTYIVKRGNYFGALNYKQDEILPFEYTNIEYLPGSEGKLLRVEKSNSHSGILSSNGQLLTDLLYDKIGDFSENLVRVKVHDSWKFVNEKGAVMISDSFVRAQDFHEDLAAVASANGKWGFIDKDGRWQIDPIYTRAGDFSEGLAWVNFHGRIGYVDDLGEMKIKPEFDKAYSFKNGVARVIKDNETGLINKEGKWIKKPAFKNISEFDENGLAVVKKGYGQGLINEKGEIVLPCKYSSIGKFSDELACVGKDGQYGYCDKEGRLKIKLKYNQAGDFKEGIARVKVKSRWGYINEDGEIVLEPTFEKCSDFSNGRAFVSEKHNVYVIDLQGNKVPLYFDISSSSSFAEDKMLLKKYDGQYFVSSKGAVLNAIPFRAAQNFKDGIAKVKNEKWGLMDSSGFLITTVQFDKIGRFSEGKAPAYVERLSGVADLSGNILIEPQFECVKLVKKGIYYLERGGRLGYYSGDNKWLWALRN